MILDNEQDHEYGQGWAFFVSGSNDVSKLVFSEAWALGWLAAAADYSKFESIGQAVINNLVGDCLRREQFLHLCNQAVNHAREKFEFVRLPSFNNYDIAL